MILSIKDFEAYLGQPVSYMLSQPPFRDWPYERTIENDLEEPIIDYVFYDDGIDITCDYNDKVSTLFLYCDDKRRFKNSLIDLPFTLTREQVRAQFGSPCRSGEKIDDKILGPLGPWDRFKRHGYSIHTEYGTNSDHVAKITIMRADVVP